jgi:hypothetical protein
MYIVVVFMYVPEPSLDRRSTCNECRSSCSRLKTSKKFIIVGSNPARVIVLGFISAMPLLVT